MYRVICSDGALNGTLPLDRLVSKHKCGLVPYFRSGALSSSSIRFDGRELSSGSTRLNGGALGGSSSTRPPCSLDGEALLGSSSSALCALSLCDECKGTLSFRSCAVLSGNCSLAPKRSCGTHLAVTLGILRCRNEQLCSILLSIAQLDPQPIEAHEHKRRTKPDLEESEHERGTNPIQCTSSIEAGPVDFWRSHKAACTKSMPHNDGLQPTGQ